MIYTVTLNPTLDRTLSVPQYVPGAVLRAQVLQRDFGGKGINVSRAMRALGINSRLIGFLGGATGRAMHEGLSAEGFATDFIEIDGETRQNITLLDEASGVYTKINEPGPRVSRGAIQRLHQAVLRQVRPGDFWVFCGSLPQNAPANLYADLIRLVQEDGARAFLDTSEEALRAGLSAAPFGIKPNGEEAGQALGHAVVSEAEHVAAARALQALGPSLVCLSCAERGIVLAMADELVLATPPPVQVRSPIGAGDAALAGLLWALSDGCSAGEAAQRIVACGTAAAMQEGTGVGDRALIMELMRQVEVRTPSS